MASHPLTHHEIFTLVEPFTRRGRHVDLAASDRIERRLAFRATEHAGAGPASPPLRETLQLEHPDGDTFRLTRIVALPGGVEARLHAEGKHPGDLLAQIEAVEPRRQVVAGDGFMIGLCHRLEASRGAGAAQLVLTRGVAQVGGLAVALNVPKVAGISGEIELSAPAGDRLDVPEDLLAVIGWDWGRIGYMRGAWRGSLKLRRREPERSRDAERKLQRTAEHLARTLAEPPGQYHDRLVRARWEVTFRRAIPLLVCVGLIAASLAVPYLSLSEDSVFRMLIFNAPPLLLALFFSLREIPRIEIPPMPRRLTASAWRRPDPQGER